MARDDTKLKSAKAAYKQAVANGNRQEEARWANVIGDILKCRGEYVEALRWLRIDYEVSTKYLPEKHLLPTCQSVGEVYLRLQQYREALYYQKKHLELAKENDDLVEQQRACTQLGRTYYEMFSRSENDHYSKRSAKKYFKMALELARNLRTKPQQKSCFFVKEYIDAQNNLGMLEMDLDNFDEAERILLEGLQICDEEEVAEFDDARSRLHNNLGSVYIELRAWNKAKEHIEKDIIICQKICHLQGEAKGYINLGELHYRVQKYEEAQLCYRKALDIAKSLEDEDALVDQINQNIETVKEASKVLQDIKVEEQRLKKLARTTVIAKGKPNERRCLLDQCASLDLLIEKSSIIFMWSNHREFAKRKKRVATELCDKEKLSDSFLAIGESYQKLRNFSKARKWYMKSWNMFRSIGNLEGQALAKINIGAVLDSAGDWAGALQSFEEGYRLASEGKLLSAQISALDNMHYSNMIRFDNMEEARKLQQEINTLKCCLNDEDEPGNESTQCCSETESDRGHLSDCASDSCNSPSFSARLEMDPVGIESDDNAPLSTLVQSGKAKKKLTQLASIGKSIVDPGHTKKDSSKDNCSLHQVGRKRVRVVLSDDELADDDESGLSAKKLPNSSFDDLITSEKGREGGKHNNPKTNNAAFEDLEKEGTSCSPTNFDESTCSFKSESPKSTALNSKAIGSISLQELPVTSPSGASEFKTDGLQAYSTLEGQKDAFWPQISSDSVEEHLIPCKIGEEMIFTDISCCATDDTLDIEAFKIQIACMYYLRLCDDRRSKGLLPIIQHLKCGGKILGASEPLDEIKDYISQKECVHVVLDGWVHNRLIKLYIDQCKKLAESPNIKLVKKLYNLEVSEDEVVISDCDLQDMSISPFLDALHEHKTISSLDVSHNLLGNGTLEKLQQILASSSQKYGGLALDLHCNRFGPTALFQICECNVLFTRLEVLNLSDNRLTDACGSYLSTILQNCRALHSLKIENCSITSRTIQRMADSLDHGSLLSELYLGRNNPISGTAMINLLTKLASLKRISELSLDAVKLSKPVADALCLLAKSSNLSCLMLGATNIGAEGSAQLVDALSGSSQELVKLDLSRCSLRFQTVAKICESDGSLANLLDLNLRGNVLGLEGSKAVISLLKNPISSLRVLTLDKCFIGPCGIIHIIQALAGNEVLEELNLAENVTGSHGGNLEGQSKMDSKTTGAFDHSSREAQTAQQESSSTTLNLGCERQEVADSEDNPSGSSKPNPSELDDCASSGERRPSTGHQFIEEISKAIEKATFLQSLDLSGNGFSAEAAQRLFQAWCTSKNVGSAGKHIKDNIIIHFSIGGKKCCGVKTCCRRY